MQLNHHSWISFKTRQGWKFNYVVLKEFLYPTRVVVEGFTKFVPVNATPRRTWDGPTFWAAARYIV